MVDAAQRDQSPNPNSLDNREINREFLDFGPVCTILVPNRRANSAGYNKIPYATEQGIFSAEQGMFLRDQRISVEQQGSGIGDQFQAGGSMERHDLSQPDRDCLRHGPAPAGPARVHGAGRQCASPSIECLRGHAAGASNRRATPIPCGSRPSTAALTRLGARKASEIVMLTWRLLQACRAAHRVRRAGE